MRKLHLLTAILLIGGAAAFTILRANREGDNTADPRIARVRPAAPRLASKEAPQPILREAREPAATTQSSLANQPGEDRHDDFGQHGPETQPVFLTLPDGSVGRVSSCSAPQDTAGK